MELQNCGTVYPVDQYGYGTEYRSKNTWCFNAGYGVLQYWRTYFRRDTYFSEPGGTRYSSRSVARSEVAIVDVADSRYITLVGSLA